MLKEKKSTDLGFCIQQPHASKVKEKTLSQMNEHRRSVRPAGLPCKKCSKKFFRKKESHVSWKVLIYMKEERQGRRFVFFVIAVVSTWSIKWGHKRRHRGGQGNKVDYTDSS